MGGVVVSFIRSNLQASLSFALVLGFASAFFVVGHMRGDGCAVALESTTSPNPEEAITVDLSGAVSEPGLYEVPADTRVGELLAIAGGFLQDASKIWASKNVNLSEKLVDSQKVYVPFEWEVYAPKDVELASVRMAASEEEVKEDGVKGGAVPFESVLASSNVYLINVNTATLGELETLSGIGPAYAQRIIDNRPYSDFTQFTESSAIPEGVCKKVKTLITFD